MDANESEELMQTSQREAVEKAMAVLSEHFEHALIVVTYEPSGDPPPIDGRFESVEVEATEMLFHGGAVTALGMAAWAAWRLRSAPPRKEADDL